MYAAAPWSMQARAMLLLDQIQPVLHANASITFPFSTGISEEIIFDFSFRRNACGLPWQVIVT
jgi:hypothetical protein